MSVSNSDVELGHIGKGKVLNVEQEDMNEIGSTTDNGMPSIKKQNYGRSLRKCSLISCNLGSVHSNDEMPTVHSIDEMPRLFAPNRKKMEYDRSLKGLRIISLTSYILSTINLFLVVCALTWATTVLLGSYVQDLDSQHFIEVPILLFLEYIRIGLVAFQRTVGYKLPKRLRRLILFAEIFLPLGMGGFAVLGYISDYSREKVSNAPQTAVYGDLPTALRIFYVLIILSAVVIFAELIIKGVLNIYFLRLSTAKSLHNYHDNMFQRSNSWLYSWVDLEFAFKMQSFEYKHANVLPEDVCKEYADLVWYLYVHEGGFEAAESALGDSDSYVRQAAANMVGFWAVLEKLPEVQEGCRLPLKFQKGLLSKLADVAAQSYGPTGMAAARSIGLLLQGVDPVGMATGVKSESGEGLVGILVKRVNQLLPPLWPNSALAETLRAEACTYVHALRKLLQQLEVPEPEAAQGRISASIFTQAQREQIVTEMEKSLLQENSAFNTSPGGSSSIDYTIQRLDRHLNALISPAHALHSHGPDGPKDYYSLFKHHLKPLPDGRSAYIRKVIRIVVAKLFLYVGSIFVGLLVGGLIDHR